MASQFKISVPAAYLRGVIEGAIVSELLNDLHQKKGDRIRLTDGANYATVLINRIKVLHQCEGAPIQVFFTHIGGGREALS